MFGLSTRRKMVIAGCVLIAVAAGLACNDQPGVELAETGDVGVMEDEGDGVGSGGDFTERAVTDKGQEVGKDGEII